MGRQARDICSRGVEKSKQVYDDAKRWKFPAVHVSITVLNRDGSEKHRSRTMVFMNEEQAHEYFDYKNDQLDQELPNIGEAINELFR